MLRSREFDVHGRAVDLLGKKLYQYGTCAGDLFIAGHHLINAGCARIDYAFFRLISCVYRFDLFRKYSACGDPYK